MAPPELGFLRQARHSKWGKVGALLPGKKSGSERLQKPKIIRRDAGPPRGSVVNRHLSVVISS